MEIDTSVPLLSPGQELSSKQENLESGEILNQAPSELLKQENQENYSSSLFGFEISWDERKRLALEDLTSNGIRYENDPDYMHWLAYHQYSQLISKEIESNKNRLEMDRDLSTQKLTTVYNLLKKNKFGLSPLIYSIWGEIDQAMKARNNNGEDFLIRSQINAEENKDEASSTAIIFNYLHIFMEKRAESRDSRLYGSTVRLPFNEDLANSELFEYELGHIFKHNNLAMLDLANVLYHDNTISLSYLIESEDETLINTLSIQNDKESPLLCSIQKKYTGCTELLIKYVIELLNNNTRSISIKSKVEQEFEKIIISSSSLISVLIESMLVSVKKIQFRSDIDDLPMVVFTNTEDLETLRETEFRDNENSDQILNTQLLRSSIRLPSVSGSSSSLNLISSLHFCQTPIIFKVPLIKYYLNEKWDSLWSYIFFQTLLTWSNIPLLIGILSENSSQQICVIVFICVNCLLLAIEAIQIFSLGVFKYLGDVNKLAAYYLLKLCLIFFMYLFYENIVVLLFSSCAVIFAIYLQIDQENRCHATSIEVMTVLVGISIITGWGWWIYLIVATIFGGAIYGIGALETTEQASRILMIFHAAIAFVSFFVWVEWDTLYFMIPLGFVIGLMFFGMSIPSATKKLPIIALFSSTIRMTIAMLFCIFSYTNLSIAIILLSMNLAAAIGAIISFYNEKIVESYVKLSLGIGNVLISLCIVLAIDDMMDIFKLGLFIIPFATLLYDHKIVQRSSRSENKLVLSLLKLFPITILFLANFQSYSELLLSILAMTAVNLCIEVTVTERFSNNLIKNIYKMTLNWNTIDIVRLSFCLVWIYYYFKDEEIPTLVIYLLASFTLLRGITGFRCFSGTRYYVRLVLDSTANIKDFIFLFFYATFAFGVLSNLSQDQDITFQSIWINSYYLNLGTYSDIEEINLSYIIFFFATIINVIIMLNLLISVLGDSFQKFQISAADIDYMEMVDVIKEVETVMIWNRSRTDKGHLVVIDLVRDQNSPNESELEGKISKIRKDIRDEINPLKTELQNLKEVINSRAEMSQNGNNFKQGVRDEVEPLKSEIKELKEVIQKLLDSQRIGKGSEINEE